MTDKTIDQLEDGGVLKSGDAIPVRRNGETLKAILGSNGSQSRRLAVIGTSLVQQNDEANDSSYRISHSNRGWLTWLRAYTKGRVDCPIWYDNSVLVGWEPSGVSGATRFFRGLNLGVSGQLIDEIIARLPYIETNFIDQFTDIVIDAGTNDMAGETKENIQDDREAICNFFLQRGKTVHLLPILNRDSATWDATKRAKANWINQKSIQFTRNNFNCFLLDWNTPWVDPNSTTGDPLTDFSYDGTHFDNLGGEAVGEFMAEYFNNILPPVGPRVLSNDDQYDATNNPYGCLISNPMLLGTGGNVADAKASGDLADDMEIESRDAGTTEVVCSKDGNKQVLTFNTIDATSQEFYFRTDSANLSHSLANGWVQASVDIETNNSEGIENISLVCDDISGTDGNFGEDMNGVGGERWSAKERDIRLITPPVQMKADSTSLRIRVVILIKGTVTVDPVIKISNFEIRQVPDPTF